MWTLLLANWADIRTYRRTLSSEFWRFQRGRRVNCRFCITLPRFLRRKSFVFGRSPGSFWRILTLYGLRGFRLPVLRHAIEGNFGQFRSLRAGKRPILFRDLSILRNKFPARKGAERQWPMSAYRRLVPR
jgi:hypothetical protein